jgi:GTP-binding protein
VERCKLLLHLVDVSEAAPQEPVEALQKINRELSLYSPLLSEKPQVVVATKLDVASPERLRQIQRHCQQGGIDFFAISAVRKEGLRELLQHVARRLKAP